MNDDAMFTNMRGSIIEGYKASLPATALVQNIATEDGVSATITIAPKFYVFENPQVKAAREMNGAENFKPEDLATEIVVISSKMLKRAEVMQYTTMRRKQHIGLLKLLRRMKWQQLRLSI